MRNTSALLVAIGVCVGCGTESEPALKAVASAAPARVAAAPPAPPPVQPVVMPLAEADRQRIRADDVVLVREDETRVLALHTSPEPLELDDGT